MAKKQAAKPKTRMKTSLPGPKSQKLIELRQKHVTNAASMVLPAFIAKAEADVLVDVDGNRYLDLATGIATLNTGHRPKEIVRAVKAQMDRYTHLCFQITPYDVYVRLAQELSRIMPGNLPKTLFVNTGAEANEQAVKVARWFTKKPHTVSFYNAFHGRTLMTLALTGKEKPYKEGFGPFDETIHHAEFAYCYRCAFGLTYPACNFYCLGEVEKLLDASPLVGETNALISEPIQGEGGFVVPPPDYFGRLKKILDARGILFIDDEIQTGMGRTGKWFAIEHWGVQPDLVTTAKALGGGLPIAAVTGRADILDAPQVGGLGTTFGGNPVSCAASLEALKLIRRHLGKVPGIAKIMQQRLTELQSECPLVGDVRGIGGMWAIELVTDRERKTPAAAETKAISKLCHQRGVLTITAGRHDNVVRFLPAFTMTKEHLNEALDVVTQAAKEVAAGAKPA